MILNRDDTRQMQLILLFNYIKLLKEDRVDVKLAKIKIKEKLNKKISTKSILNLWT